MKDIFKRHVRDFFSTSSGRAEDRPSLTEELGMEVRQRAKESAENALFPERAAREEKRRAADLERVRAERGTGQAVVLDGLRGEWEATELLVSDETTATFTLIDRASGDEAQLGATDDGLVILDTPDDQLTARGLEGAFWQDGSATGIRLDGVEVRSDSGRTIRISCDLRADLE